MPSLGQNGGAMNDSLAQHSAQTPSPSTGSRQATQSVGSAISSASRAACTHAPRHAFSAPRRWAEMDRDGDASASIRHRLASSLPPLKRQGGTSYLTYTRLRGEGASIARNGTGFSSFRFDQKPNAFQRQFRLQ